MRIRLNCSFFFYFRVIIAAMSPSREGAQNFSRKQPNKLRSHWNEITPRANEEENTPHFRGARTIHPLRFFRVSFHPRDLPSTPFSLISLIFPWHIFTGFVPPRGYLILRLDCQTRWTVESTKSDIRSFGHRSDDIFAFSFVEELVAARIFTWKMWEMGRNRLFSFK